MLVPKSDLHNNRVVIASNRLPVNVARTGGQLQITPSVGGLTTGLSSFHRCKGGLWIGWPGINPTSSKTKVDLEKTLQHDYNCLPVYLSASDLKKYYYGFSNRTLWPLFHYFTTYCTFNASEWETYQKVNQMFCQKLIDVVRPDDIIWIHDYHLLLLPEMLRSNIPDITIGFFLHIPFPSMEVFRYLPWREEILQGMLGADLIGFHTYDYTRHFFSCALRILGKEQVFGQINSGNRMVRVETFPMGIDADKFSEAATSPTVKKEKELLQNNLNTEKIILSVDRLDFTKGIPEHLQVFERFLEKYPEWHGRIIYVLLCVPSRTKVEEYQQLKSEIDEIVGKINGRYGTPGWQPVLYIYRSLPFEELTALYSAADIALVTPLRDGMNLVAKEYLACQSQTKKGVLILSETAGSAAELGEAFIVNPRNIEMVGEAINHGLSAPAEEKEAWISLMFQRIKTYNIFRWAEDFINQLAQAREQREQSQHRFLTKENQAEVIESYRRAKSRLLLLDFDGTLVSLKKRPEQVRPDSKLLKILSALKAEPKNTVVVISGRDQNYLSDWLGKTGVDMVAEHGTWLYESTGGNWRLSAENITTYWKENFYPVLEKFSESTPGSFIEEKSHALAWHYRKADPELGQQRTKELVDTLRTLLSGTSLQVLLGNKVVEIKPSGVNKGKAALHWLEKLESWDFILAVGDDWTDEDIFAVLPEEAWSIKVGFVPITKAHYFMSSSDEVRNLLKSLAGA